jgi:hypothetical protein
MTPVITHNLASIVELCRRYRVARFEAFGSGARGDFDPHTSDLDFLVEFEPLSPAEHARAYFSLLGELQDLFTRDVDLVEARAIRNPYFQQAVDRERVELYAA